MNYIKNKNKNKIFNSNSISIRLFFTILSFTILSMEAHATGLQKAKGILDIIRGEILTIVPIIAVIALIGLGIGYALNSVQKETFMRWAVGLIIVGSAAQITTMLLG